MIPSFLRMRGTASSKPFLNNIMLRVGEVQEVVHPNDPRSRSKKFDEYRVFVQHTENGTAVTRMYENCVVANLFGGRADKFTYTLRAEKNANRVEDFRNGKTRGAGGSKVLLLCINGETHCPMIIGGLRDSEVDHDPKEAKDQGHNLFFEFNGVAVTIDKDGAMSLAVRGATTSEGNPAEGVATDKLPSTVTIDKEGTIAVGTKDGKSSIVLEQSGKVTVNSSSEVTVNAKKAKIKASSCVVDADKIELGGENIALPPNGLVHGTWIEPLTGKPVFMLGGSSRTVFGKK